MPDTFPLSHIRTVQFPPPLVFPFPSAVPCLFRVLVGKPEGKRPLGKPRRRWEDNIKMDLQEVGWGCGNRKELAQYMDMWRALVNTVMNLRVPKMWEISWLAAEPVSFSRRTLPCLRTDFPRRMSGTFKAMNFLFLRCNNKCTTSQWAPSSFCLFSCSSSCFTLVFKGLITMEICYLVLSGVKNPSPLFLIFNMDF